MEQVTLDNMDAFIERYAVARGGELNEQTDSEAMFVFKSQFGGAFILNTGLGILWIGIQNASSRWSNGGKPFPSVRAALSEVLSSTSPTQSIGAGVFYSEDSVSRMRLLADQIAEFKESGTFLIHLET